MATDLEQLQQRIVALEDREEIRQVIEEYRRTLQARDLHAFSQLFAESGTFRGRRGEATGPVAIQSMLEASMGADPADPGRTLFNLNTDASITLDRDRATAFTYWVHISRDDSDGPILTVLGHYDDVLIKEQGRWRFLTREVYRHIPSETATGICQPR